MKRSFFQAAVVSILLYGCTTWTLTKRLEKKLDDNYTRMLRAILNKSWRQHPTRRQLYVHLPPITKTIQVRRARHAGHCWRSNDELVSDVLLWTPTYGQAKAGRPALTYIQQLCEDTGCNPEDLPEAMNDRERWREMVKDIRAGGTTWWWRWWWCKSDKGPYSRLASLRWLQYPSIIFAKSCISLHWFSLPADHGFVVSFAAVRFTEYWVAFLVSIFWYPVRIINERVTLFLHLRSFRIWPPYRLDLEYAAEGQSSTPKMSVLEITVNNIRWWDFSSIVWNTF